MFTFGSRKSGWNSTACSVVVALPKQYDHQAIQDIMPEDHYPFHSIVEQVIEAEDLPTYLDDLLCYDQMIQSQESSAIKKFI